MQYESASDRVGHFLFKKYTKDSYPSRNINKIPTFHNSIEVILVSSGKFEVYINGAWRVFEEGSIVYIDKLVPHSTRGAEYTEDLEAYVLVITLPYLSAVREIDEMTFDSILFKNDGYPEILEFIKWGHTAFQNMNDDMKCGYATMLFGMLKKHYPMHKKAAQNQTKLLFMVMEYINQHYSEHITLETLSHKFGYEKTYLSKTVNSLLGMNLREYLNRYRIIMVDRLKNGNPDEPIWQIAEKCGFESPNTFYRAQKKYSK